jgi:hypothetical protein
MAINQQQLLSKIKTIQYTDNTHEPHEQDNIPNPFKNFTTEELLYLQQHKELLSEQNTV